MKKSIIFFLFLTCFSGTEAKAQWVVNDPMNFAQSIVNTVMEIAETAVTAENMVKNFEETVKIYEQSKEYYDKLKSVSNLVRDARKVQQTILLVGDISDIYVTNFKKMLKDENYTIEELNAIAFGYTQLLGEGAALLKELQDVINITDMSMTDKERMDLIDRVYYSVKKYRDLTNYYTKKNIGISYLRAKKKNDTDRIISLYGNSNKYW